MVSFRSFLVPSLLNMFKDYSLYILVNFKAFTVPPVAMATNNPLTLHVPGTLTLTNIFECLEFHFCVSLFFDFTS